MLPRLLFSVFLSVSHVLICFFACFLFVSSASAQSKITRTDIDIAKGAERITLNAKTSFEIRKSFQLQNPPRYVIDIARMTSGAGVGLSPQYSGEIIRDIRFGQFDAQTSRIVIDLQAPVKTAKSYVHSPRGGQGWQLVVDLTRGSGAISPRAARNTPIKQSSSWVAPIPQDKPEAIAREVRKPLIVIDAGHGGKDTGAIGRKKTREKDITLKYARALRHTLLQSGKYRVVLTRDSDKYLFLKQRVKIARNNKADLFISLHADSNPNRDAQGLSVYTVSEKASDAEAAALAAQENKSDIIGGIDLANEDKAVADILLDLARRETKNKSSELAETLIENMHRKIPLLTNTHRYAGFRVLKAPDVPSVLVEIGFLTNSSDERTLQTREYQDKFTRSILKGLDAYFAE